MLESAPKSDAKAEAQNRGATVHGKETKPFDVPFEKTTCVGMRRKNN